MGKTSWLVAPGSRVLRNTLSNYGVYGLDLAVGLFLQAYLVRKLGSDQYSLLPLVVSCIAYLQLLNLGLGLSLSRYISSAHARGDNEEVTRIATSIFVTLSGIALVMVLVGSFIALFFSRFFTVPPGLGPTATGIMLLLTLGSALQMPFSVFSVAFVATQQYYLNNLLTGGISLLNAVLIVLCLTFLEENAIWVAVCLTGTTIVRLLLQWKAAREVLPSLRLKFSTFSWQVIGSVGSFSLIAFISQLSGLLYWHTDRLVINHCLTPLDLTLYSVATSLAIYVYDLTQVPTSVFFPVLAGLEATGNLAQIPPLLVRGTRLCIIVSLPFCIIFSTLAEPLFLLYLGPAYQGAGLFVPIVMVSVLSSSSTCFLRQVPTAIGKPGFISFIEITFALINLALTLIFVIRFHWGLAGVAWGTTIATVIKNWIVIPWYLTSLVGLNLRQLARQVFQGILPSSLIGLILIPIIFYVPLLQWKVWFSLFAGLGPIYFLLVYFLSLEGTDKALLKKILSGITFRFSCLNK